MMAERDDDDFLKRWSRRKVEARHGLRRTSEPPPEGVVVVRLTNGSFQNTQGIRYKPMTRFNGKMCLLSRDLSVSEPIPSRNVSV